METATVEDIADVYLQGWKLGLKALAVYRDNCKVGQPLSDAKSSSADDKAVVPPNPRLRSWRRWSTGRPANGAPQVAAQPYHVFAVEAPRAA